MKRGLAALALLLAAGACATPTPYQAAATDGYGYSERRIEADRYSLSFSGNSLTDRERVENYLLFRAAELTLAQGYDYFIVTNRDTDANSRLVGTASPSRLYRYSWYHPVWGWRPFYDPLWDDDVTLREVTRYRAIGEIVLRRGEKPNDPNAFDARQVVQNLQSVIQRPAS